jgi:hypothetical protein
VTLGGAHEIGLALASTLAFVIALVGGQLSPFAWIVIAAPAVSAFLRPKERSAPATSGTVIALASLGLGAATLVQRGLEAAVLAGGYALAGILVARILTRTTLAHDLQVLLVSLLLVIAGSVLNLKLSYGALFVVYGIAVVWAMITRELLRGAERSSEGDPRRLRAMRARRDVITPAFLFTTSAIALVVLLSTSLVFVLFPRVGVGNLGFLRSGSGNLPGAVSLRGAPRGSAGGNAVVARVFDIPEDAFLRGLYLRGAIYEQVDWQGFSQRQPPPAVEREDLELAAVGVDASYEVYLNPGAGRILLSLGDFVSMLPLTGGHANPGIRLGIGTRTPRGEARANSVVRTAFRYRVFGTIASPPFVGEPSPEVRGERTLSPDGDAAVFFSLPSPEDPRLAALVTELVGDAQSPREKAMRLRTYLLNEFEYTLEQPNAEAEQPLASFLLDDRRGHCEYFASAYALLLRTQGIPSRVVGGYQGGSWDPADGTVVFTERNAHAWVEWFEPGTGWIVDDPTPLATAPRVRLEGFAALLERIQRFWDDSVLDYAFSDQLDLARGLRDAMQDGGGEGRKLPWPAILGGLFGAVALALVVAALRRARRRGGGDRPGRSLARALEAAVHRCGASPVHPEETLREAVGRAAPRVSGEDARVLRDALRLYEGLRFGAQRPGPTAEQAARRSLDSSRRRLPSRTTTTT